MVMVVLVVVRLADDDAAAVLIAEVEHPVVLVRVTLVLEGVALLVLPALVSDLVLGEVARFLLRIEDVHRLRVTVRRNNRYEHVLLLSDGEEAAMRLANPMPRFYISRGRPPAPPRGRRGPRTAPAQ